MDSDEWQSGDLLGDGETGDDTPTNSKIGWIVFDLGSVQTLDELYIWHVRENAGRVATDFNVYVASTPTVSLTNGPTGGNSIDYDFSSGGWSTVATGLVGTHQGSSVVDLSGNSGQYIGLEMIANGGDSQRVGFAEVGITAVPEPSVFVLIGLAGMALLARRRRA